MLFRPGGGNGNVEKYPGTRVERHSSGFSFSSPALAFPANIVVPKMDLITRGAMDGGAFTLQTFGDLTLEVLGGYKFGGSLAFSLNNTNLENFSTTSLPLGFLSASIIIRDLFSVPLSLTYFVGQNDTFCSGDGFALFGAQPIMTAYRGFMYFPTGPVYDGIYQVQGTGARFEFVPKIESFSMDFYVYEDTRSQFPGITVPGDPPIISSPGTFSSDLRFLLNYAAIKVEGFLGGTLTSSSLDYYFRGGLLFYATNNNVEFLGQIGVPKWDPDCGQRAQHQPLLPPGRASTSHGRILHHPDLLLAPVVLHAGRPEPGRGGLIRREPEPCTWGPVQGCPPGRIRDQFPVPVRHAGRIQDFRPGSA